MTSIGPSGANIVGLAIQLSPPVFVSFVQEAARGNTHPSRCTAMLNHHSCPLGLDSGQISTGGHRAVSSSWPLQSTATRPSMMSLLCRTGCTYEIGKSACGGYRHNPPERIAASKMLGTRLPFFHPKGDRRTSHFFSE